MSLPPAFAAELLRASGGALAGVAAARLLEAHPSLAERYGEAAFASWRAHLTTQLGNLAAAVEERDPAVFAREVGWSRAAAEGRELPHGDLTRALDALEETLRERMPQVPAEVWSPALTAARATLTAPAPEAPTPLAAPGPAAAFLALALAGRSREARALVVDQLTGGGWSAERLVEEVLLPAAREAGRRWHLGELAIAEEHIVTSTVRAALCDLSASAPIPEPDAPCVLIAAVPGDGHDTALYALGALLEYDGWRAAVAGADTPVADLARTAGRIGARVVALSATLAVQRHALRLALEDLRAAPGFEAQLMVGGPAVPDEAAARALGADAFAPSLTRAVALANRLIGR